MAKRPKSAFDSLMELLARRDHSELELRKKLLRRYSSSEVELALRKAKEQGWLLPPETLSEKVASTLSRKMKSNRYINGYLRQRGLPPLTSNPDEELEKARRFIQNKTSRSKKALDKAKAARLLASRGFDAETIRKVLYEEFGDSS
ncbi:MAG: RecX family transcriptional regulator [Bdellovibrionaceae bacterium]|nr:RecX family transcriptional regulator [Pseudobdellovibrionaceae bacterium]